LRSAVGCHPDPHPDPVPEYRERGSSQNPHPNPLPEYRERGKRKTGEKKRQAVGSAALGSDAY
jgi:hypothetical protein